MSSEDARRWDARYREQFAAPSASVAARFPAAAEVLAENTHLLPRSGRALDLACGLAGSAFVLARAGLDSHAWDVSAVVIEQVRAQAGGFGVALSAVVRDVVAEPPAPDSFDVIVVRRFLDRALMPRLLAALRPGGLLFYQTFTAEKLAGRGPDQPAFLLGRNELLTLCAGLTLRAYRENGAAGDPGLGLRDEAWLVGEKPGQSKSS